MAVEVDKTCNEADGEVSEVGCSPTERVRTMLDERGVEHYDHENGEPLRDLSEAGTDPATSWRMGGANVCAVPNKQGTFDLWIDHCTPEQAIAATVEPNKTAEWRSVALGLFGSLENADLETAKQWIAGNELLREELAYGEAKAATVGGKPEDNPQNYKPNGEPKIPNMPVGADPDWVDWVASLEHKEPSNLTEAVRQLMFETICFGGDMGPNDCGGEYCPDEGMVHTNNFIESWVHTIAELAGYGIQFAAWCDTPPEMMVGETLYDGEGNAVGWVTNGATMGVGTCKLVDNDSGPDMHCTACGGEVDDEYRYFMDSWGYSRCPHCGARIIEEEAE